jgi:putative endonuclease|tara:strand:- start:41 stop:406 length:366 start_codon:yes stop_codon:yes gene_type:complete
VHLFGPQSTRAFGKQQETLGNKFLQSRGLQPITQNYQYRAGEIDLILTDKNQLVFVEVRYRKGATFGSAIESVTVRKQAKLRRCAQHYLLNHSAYAHWICRFDVLGIHPISTKPGFEFNWC